MVEGVKYSTEADASGREFTLIDECIDVVD